VDYLFEETEYLGISRLGIELNTVQVMAVKLNRQFRGAICVAASQVLLLTLVPHIKANLILPFRPSDDILSVRADHDSLPMGREHRGRSFLHH